MPEMTDVVENKTEPEDLTSRIPVPEYRDDDRCTACGGKCCRIYASKANGGMWNPLLVEWSLWVGRFHKERERYGVSPRYDALALHLGALMDGEEEYNRQKEELQERGIDPEYCEYCGPKGCIIPWEKRPERCKEYRCKPWREEDSFKRAG